MKERILSIQGIPGASRESPGEEATFIHESLNNNSETTKPTADFSQKKHHLGTLRPN